MSFSFISSSGQEAPTTLPPTLPSQVYFSFDLRQVVSSLQELSPSPSFSSSLFKRPSLSFHHPGREWAFITIILLLFLLRLRGASSSHYALQSNNHQLTIFVWSTSLTLHSISSIWEAIYFPCTVRYWGCSCSSICCSCCPSLSPSCCLLWPVIINTQLAFTCCHRRSYCDVLLLVCHRCCRRLLHSAQQRSVPKDQRARADTTPPSSLPCIFTLSFAFSPCCQEQSSVHLLPHRQASISGEVIRSSVVGWCLVVKLLISEWVSFLCCLVRW